MEQGMKNKDYKNRIDTLFDKKKEGVLSVYFTAGFPKLEDTLPVLKALQQAGCDMVEVGMPFSDPLADGPVIQQSSTKALANGMTTEKLLHQLKDFRKEIHIPVLLMGYLNPVLQYGMEKFCKDISTIGIDGLILPDMPLEVCDKEFKPMFEKYNLHNILLITPRTTDERIREIEKSGSGFIYAVSSSATTGSAASNKEAQQKYFERLKTLKFNLPVMIGFGISNHEQFQFACRYANGGIIGTAFIRQLEQETDIQKGISSFIQSIKR